MGKKSKPKRDHKKTARSWSTEIPRGANIGHPDAIHDSFYLEGGCFIETDIYKDIANPANERSLLVGRTGTGKTAYMQNIKKVSTSNKHILCTEIDVDSEFFDHLDGLRSVLSKEGQQNLVLLLKALWMHILVVQLARVLFPSRDDFLVKLNRRLSKKSHESQMLDYINRHENAVWDGGSSAQIVEKITQKMDAYIDPQATIGSSSLSVGRLGGSREKVTEIKENKKNPKGLSHILNFAELKRFAKVICDNLINQGSTCYVLIDKLDTEWAPSPVRYTLIRVLTETVRDFYSLNRDGNVKKSSGDPYPVKIIVALRRDLLDIVNIQTKTPGYQSEKILPFECDITWSKQELRKLVDKRIRYWMEYHGKKNMGFYDIFPATMTGHGSVRKAQDTLTYIEERTLQRPRDIIEFVNSCFKQLIIEKRSVLTEAMIKHAEEEYSKNRFRSVTEEWVSMYPGLDAYARVLWKFKGNFKFGEFRDKMKDLLLNLQCDDPRYEEWVRNIERDTRGVARDMLNIFCKTGIVMVKLSPIKSYETCSQNIEQGQCKPDLQIKIHPMFYAYFGVDDRNID